LSASLHVVHAVLSLDIGGLERIVVDLVREGHRLGQQVSVLCVERPGMLAPQAEALGAHVFCINKKPGLRVAARGPITTALRVLRPDVLHTHQVGALFYAGPAAQAGGVPVIVHTEHINHIRKAGAGYVRQQRMSWLWWWSARYARKFFCVSKDIADEMAARRIVPRDKLAVILNGINPEPFQTLEDRERIRHSLGIPSGIPLIGTLGRLNEVKCQDLLLRAFVRVRTMFPAARLLVVGDGPRRDALRELTTLLGLDGTVHFAGYQLQPERFLAAMDVFALTSRMEGLPLAILEAWAARLPVIASAVGGVPDLIDHGRNGLLFPSGEESQLAHLLCELLGDPCRTHALGKAGREEVLTRYNLQRMATDYQRHYQELLGHRLEPRLACVS
jgi:glycosyltransferase involved in cell wall biosynthesis